MGELTAVNVRTDFGAKGFSTRGSITASSRSLNVYDIGPIAVGDFVIVENAAASGDLQARVEEVRGSTLMLAATAGRSVAAASVHVDDRDAIQRAADAVHAARGGILYLPPGSYAISDRIALGRPDDATRWQGSILGAGRGGSTIRVTRCFSFREGRVGLHLVRTENITIRGLTFAGSGDPQFLEIPLRVYSGASPDDNLRLLVTDVEITNASRGIHLFNSRNAKIVQCYIRALTGRYEATPLENGGWVRYGHGIVCEGGDGNELLYNSIDGTPGHGILLRWGESRTAVVGNRITGARTAAIHLSSRAPDRDLPCDDIVIAENHVLGVVSDHPEHCNGIECIGRFHNVRIADNSLYNVERRFIELSSTSGEWSDADVSGNRMVGGPDGPEDWCVFVEGYRSDSRAGGVRVFENLIDAGTERREFGPSPAAPATRHVIGPPGNVIERPGGLHLSRVDRAYVKHNLIHPPRGGARIRLDARVRNSVLEHNEGTGAVEDQGRDNLKLTRVVPPELGDTRGAGLATLEGEPGAWAPSSRSRSDADSQRPPAFTHGWAPASLRPPAAPSRLQARAS